MWHFFSQPFTRAIAGILITSFLCAPVLLAPQPVQAQQIVNDPLNWVENKFSAIMSSISASALKSLGLKEWALDGVLFALAKKALQQMVRSTIAWINSGFKGSPMYITNPEQFLTNIGDEIAGDIIYGSELNFLCSPIDIRIALEFYYTKSRGRIPQCTLTQVVGNVDQFLEGNFMAGGWPGFLALSVSPTSQPLGGVIAATAALEARVGAAQGNQVMRLNWGSGFLSWEECTDEKDKSTCQIMTPGKTIADALTFELSVGERTLIEADEINELIGALFAQLGSQALSGLRGVRGLSQSGYTFGGGGSGSGSVPSYCSSLSYLDQLDDPSCNANIGGTFGTSTIPGDGASFIAEALTAERNFQSMYRAVADRAANAVEDAEAEGLQCTANANVAERATDIGALAEEQLVSSTERVLRLQEIDETYRTGTGEEQVAAVQEYLQLQTEGTLRSDVTNALEQRTVDGINAEIDTLRSRIQTCREDEEDEDPAPVTYYFDARDLQARTRT